MEFDAEMCCNYDFDILSEPPCWQYGPGQSCLGCLSELTLQHKNAKQYLPFHINNNIAAYFLKENYLIIW